MEREQIYRITNSGKIIPVGELVRCMDCKHGINGTYDLKENRVIYIDCDKAETHEPDWFCADGKRKE